MTIVMKVIIRIRDCIIYSWLNLKIEYLLIDIYLCTSLRGRVLNKY